MMTPTARMTAAADLMTGMAQDTTPCSDDQLAARIMSYCDDPATTTFDRWVIFTIIRNAD
jgi:hypothetical protein